MNEFKLYHVVDAIRSLIPDEPGACGRLMRAIMWERGRDVSDSMSDSMTRLEERFCHKENLRADKRAVKLTSVCMVSDSKDGLPVAVNAAVESLALAIRKLLAKTAGGDSLRWNGVSLECAMVDFNYEVTASTYARPISRRVRQLAYDAAHTPEKPKKIVKAKKTIKPKKNSTKPKHKRAS